jgi:hypothetical protein
MELSLQVTFGLLVAIGSIGLANFFHAALSAPERMSLGLATTNLPSSLGGRVYLGIVVVSWIAFAFTGSYGLLIWLPANQAIELSCLVAFLSLGLLVHIERSAYILNEYRSALKVSEELKELIRYATIPFQQKIDDFQEKSRTAETLAERDAYAELMPLVIKLAERDKDLCDYAVAKAQRDALAKLEDDARKEKLVKIQLHKKEQKNKLHQVMKKAAESLQVVMTLDAALPEQVSILNQLIVSEEWQSLNAIGSRLRNLDPDKPVQEILKNIRGLSFSKDLSIHLELFGNQRDGHYELIFNQNGKNLSLFEALSFESSLEGLIAAFYMHVALSNRLAWGHGLYGRDQIILLTEDHAFSVLYGEDMLRDPEILNCIQIPVGIRVGPIPNGGYIASCMAYEPNHGLVDFAINVVNGTVRELSKAKICKSNYSIYY